MDNLIKEQKRSLKEFFFKCLHYDGDFRGMDLAVRNLSGNTKIKELMDKISNGDLNTELTEQQANLKLFNNKALECQIIGGHVLYLGDLKSDMFFCIYKHKFQPQRESSTIRLKIVMRNRPADFAVKKFMHTNSLSVLFSSMVSQYLHEVKNS